MSPSLNRGLSFFSPTKRKLRRHQVVWRKDPFLGTEGVTGLDHSLLEELTRDRREKKEGEERGGRLGKGTVDY